MKGKLFQGFSLIKACDLNLCSRAERARNFFKENTLYLKLQHQK